MNAIKKCALAALAMCGLWASDASAEPQIVPISGAGVWVGAVNVQVTVDAQGTQTLNFTQYWQLSGSLAGLLTEQVHAVIFATGDGWAQVQLLLTTPAGDTIAGRGDVIIVPIQPQDNLYRATGLVVWGDGTGKFAGEKCVESPDVLTYRSLTYKGVCIEGI